MKRIRPRSKRSGDRTIRSRNESSRVSKLEKFVDPRLCGRTCSNSYRKRSDEPPTTLHSRRLAARRSTRTRCIRIPKRPQKPDDLRNPAAPRSAARAIHRPEPRRQPYCGCGSRCNDYRQDEGQWIVREPLDSLDDEVMSEPSAGAVARQQRGKNADDACGIALEQRLACDGASWRRDASRACGAVNAGQGRRRSDAAGTARTATSGGPDCRGPPAERRPTGRSRGAATRPG